VLIYVTQISTPNPRPKTIKNLGIFNFSITAPTSILYCIVTFTTYKLQFGSKPGVQVLSSMWTGSWCFNLHC